MKSSYTFMYFIKLSIITLLSLFLTTARSQTLIGLSTDITNNNLKGDNSQNYLISSSKGFALSGFFALPLSRNLSLITQPGIIQKNYKKTSLSESALYESFRNTYFMIPVQIRFSFLKRKRFDYFVDAGGFVGYWLSGKENGQLPDILSTIDPISSQENENFRLVKFSAKKKFDSARDNRFENGITIGVGSSYKFGGKALSAKLYALRSYSNITKIYSENQPRQFNQSVNIQLTYAFEL